MTPPLHLLNGDQLAYQLQGASYFQTHLVFREALIVGPVGGTTLVEFWKLRTEFITSSYGVTAEEYNQKTISEIERLHSLPEDAEICLWFEDDLFCQINLWFLLSMLVEKPRLRIYRVFPPDAPTEKRWRGFAKASPEELELGYMEKVLFAPTDLELGQKLWSAYRQGDELGLLELSKSQSICFRKLEEVCHAQVDRLKIDPLQRRPEKAILKILEDGITDFDKVFALFSDREGIYGYGDLQVKVLFDYLVRIKQHLT
ncbi:MAG: hypothetical protein RL407_2275 [Bacteroidota bacterium]|jgi:Domain of unknown function (DUF1835)|nr:DUF1835 domain-containing protein [Cyclobacteriaceae bacterium]